MTACARHVSVLALCLALVAGCGGTNPQAYASVNSAIPWGYRPASSSTPLIRHVSKIFAEQTQTILIKGTGFGTMSPYFGDSCCLEFTVTNSECGNTWHAGLTGNGVTLSVTDWSDKKIVVAGFGGRYGQSCWSLYPGDPVTIDVWNAQTDAGPASWQTAVR
jgi:hypothetical protein